VALASAIRAHAMSALDVVHGSEAVLWRLRHRLLDTALITAFAFATLLGVALLVGSSGPVFRVADEDLGPLGPQIERALISSGQFASIRSTPAVLDQNLRDGLLDGYIRFPPDFSEAALAGRALKPEIHLVSGAPTEAATMLGALSSALLAGARTTGLQLQPQLSYVGAASVATHDQAVAGVLGMTLFAFAFLLPLIAVEPRQKWQSFLMTLGSALGCVLVALIVGLLLFLLYLALGFHSVGAPGLIVAIALLAVAAATIIGLLVGQVNVDRARVAWIVALVVVPQLLLSGVTFSLNAEPGGAQLVANLLPLPATVDALRGVMLRAAGLGSASLQRDAASMIGFILLALGVLFALRPRQPDEGINSTR
jgi:ABC-type multidrug transport system permease subunit